MSPVTLVHFVVFTSKREPVIEQLEGVKPNERRGDVVPVRAESGEQNFACGLNMKKHAGKLYEGAYHHGTGDAQFCNCPHCKETKEYKEAMAEHVRYTSRDRGIYAGIFDKPRTSMQGGTEGAVGGSGVPERPAEAVPSPKVLPPAKEKGAPAVA